MNEMITRTYSRPFHRVELHYLKGKRETKFEKELVKRYHSFVEAMSDRHQRMKPLAGRYYEEQHLIEQHDAATKDFRQRYIVMAGTIKKFRKAGTGAGIGMGEFKQLANGFRKVTEKYLQYHARKVDPWREMTAVSEAEFYALHQWFDKEEIDRAHDHFDNYSNELYRNHGNYGLCLNQWDINVDGMHGEMDEANKQWRGLFDLREETVAMFIPVAARVTEINELVVGIERDIAGMNEARMMFNN